MNNYESFIYKNIQKFKSSTNLKILNFMTNNSDIIYICPHLYLGNYNSSQNLDQLTKFNIDSIVNCTKDIPIHEYFKDRTFFRLEIDDSKDIDNINEFKKKIIDATIFIEQQVNQKKNTIVHCYWGLMRSPTVIASYLMFKYKMDVECAIEMIKDKKNCSFHNLYNFKEVLEHVKEEFDKYLFTN